MRTARRGFGSDRLMALSLALLMAVQLPLAGCSGVAHRGAEPDSVDGAQAGYAGDIDRDGQPGVGDAIGILRIVVGLDAVDRIADADADGAIGVSDAILVLRCLVGLADWPLGFGAGANELVTAVGAAGEGCMAASGAGDGQAWARNSVLSVPVGADELFIGSLSTQPNPDLQGVEVSLVSPDGTQTIVLGDGEVTCTGFVERDLSDPETDADLEGYFDSLAAELPASPTEEDYSALLDRVLGADAEDPAPEVPEGLFAAIDDYVSATSGYTDTISIDRTGLTPSDGVFVTGPRAGNWTVNVTVGADAGAFSTMAWATSDGADLATTIDNVAGALSGDVAAAETGVSAAPCEGCDPGCSGLVRDFRYPPPDTPEFYRSFALKVIYDVVVWLLLRGIFTKAIGKVLDIGAKLSPKIITPGRLKTLAIFVIAGIYKEILRYSELAELCFWRFAYSASSDDNFTRVCYIGLYTSDVSWTWSPSLSLRPGETKTLQLCAGNAMRVPQPPEFWREWQPGKPLSVATWTIDPADGMATLQPDGDQSESCGVEVDDDPQVEEGTMTVLVSNQPAKATWPVEITDVVSYVLSGSPSENTAIYVDDNLDVYLNGGAKVVDTGAGYAGPKGPFTFRAKRGDLLQFEVRDTFGSCAALGPVYLRNADGTRSELATAGFDHGCGFPSKNRGVVWWDRLTIPF